jgi:hypothetical protein
LRIFKIVSAALQNVRFWHKADKLFVSLNVRFRGVKGTSNARIEFFRF